jgi:hypothetical protein
MTHPLFEPGDPFAAPMPVEHQVEVLGGQPAWSLGDETDEDRLADHLVAVLDAAPHPPPDQPGHDGRSEDDRQVCERVDVDGHASPHRMLAAPRIVRRLG